MKIYNKKQLIINYEKDLLECLEDPDSSAEEKLFIAGYVDSQIENLEKKKLPFVIDWKAE